MNGKSSPVQTVPPADAFGLFGGPGFAVGLTVAWFAACALFAAFPLLDIAVSAAFFSDAPCASGTKPVCGAFGLARIPALKMLREFLHYLPAVVVAVLALLLVYDRFRPLHGVGARRKTMAAIALAFLAGPGLIVNGLLKPYWGRPRPSAVSLFGGDLPFVPAGVWSDVCASNCSFVSGEAAGAGILLLLVALVPRRRRWPAGLALGVVALFGAGLRVAFGAHWLSDAALGMALTIVVYAWIASGLRRAGAGRIRA